MSEQIEKVIALEKRIEELEFRIKMDESLYNELANHHKVNRTLINNYRETLKALKTENLDKEIEHVKSIKRHMIEKLNDLFPDIHYNGMSGDLEKSTYTVLNVCFPISNDKASMLDFHLDLKGIACSKGSACQSGSSSGSHVLNEIQNEKFKNLPSIRFSFSHNNSIEEVDYLIETLQDFINS